MDQKQAIRIVKKYANVINKKFSPQKVILFGSYAKGNYKEWSDIDVAVIVDKIEGDYLELESELWGYTRDIDTIIEPILLEEANDSSGFVEDILKHGIVIYDKNKHGVEYNEVDDDILMTKVSENEEGQINKRI